VAKWKKEYQQAVAYLAKTTAYCHAMDVLNRPGKTYIIEIGYWPSGDDPKDVYWPSSQTIRWDPHAALSWYQGEDELRNSPAVNLLHELAHASFHRLHPSEFATACNTPDPEYDDVEERRVIVGIVNPAAAKLGEDPRPGHGGTFKRVPGPILR
jgi:hypothetical protein